MVRQNEVDGQREVSLKEPVVRKAKSKGDDWIEATFKKYIPELVALFTLEAFAYPFFHAGAEAMLNGHFVQGVIGYFVGGFSGVAGLTFHWWKNWFSREFLEHKIFPWWPAVLFVAFIYVAGPEMYRRATLPIQVSPTTHLVLPPSITSPSEDTSPAEKEVKPTKEKIIVDASPDFFMNLYRDKMSVQADRLFNSYVGKWLKVSGNVKNIIASQSGRTSLFFKMDDERKTLFLSFEKAWAEKVTILSRDQKISALCQIERAEIFDLYLGNCELLEIPQ